MGVTLLVISGVVIIYCYCKSDSNGTNSTTQNTNQEIIQAEHITINNIDASMIDFVEELEALEAIEASMFVSMFASMIAIFNEMTR